MPRKPPRAPRQSPRPGPLEIPPEDRRAVMDREVGDTIYWYPEAGSDDTISVYRMDEIEKKYVFQCRLEPAEGHDEFLSNARGGGKYKTQLVGPDPHTGKGLIKRTHMVLLGGEPHALRLPVRSNEPSIPSRGPVPDATGVGEGSMSDIIKAGVLNLFNAQQSVQMAMMKAIEMIPRQNAAPERDNGMMQVLLELVKREPPKVPDAVELAKQVADIIGKQSSPIQGFKDMFAAMNEALDLKERVAGEASSGDPLMDMVTENVPRIIGMIQEDQRRRGMVPSPAAEIQRRLAPASAPTPLPAPEDTTVKAGDITAVGKWLAARRPILHRAATAGVDPEAMASVEWGMLPVEYRGALKEFLGREDAGALARGALSEWASFDSWYTRFMEALTFQARPEDFEVAGEDDGAGSAPEDIAAEGV